MTPRTSAFLLAAGMASCTLSAGTLTDLGLLPGGTYAYGNAISGDGTVIVGYADTASGDRAFRWTSAGMTSLGTLSGHLVSMANGISADGLVVVGRSFSVSNTSRAFRWTSGSMTDLGVLSGGIESDARGASADGSVVVGMSGSTNGDRAFRWTSAGGMVSLGILAGGTHSQAYGVSADGNVVVGYGDSASGQRAFRWTSAGGMTNLGTLTGGTDSCAYATSSDGSVVVGRASNSSSANAAFRWTVSGGMVDLGTLVGGGSSTALGVSADGSVVVGQSHSTNGWYAFRWTSTDGMTSLGALPGDTGSAATGVSADGSVIVGQSESASSTRTFIYHDAVMLDAQDWLGSVAGVHSTLSTGLELARTHLEGAHHRPLADLGRGRSYWATGDIASSSRSRDLLTRSGEAGATFEPWANVLIGIGAGYGVQDQKLANGGTARNAGQYLVGEVDLIQADGGIFSLLASAGDWNNRTDRGYVTGGGIDYSHGETDLASKAFRLRYDSPVLARAYETDLKAYVSYGHSKVRSDAYAETGGSFAGSFSAMEQTAKEGRLGLAAIRAIGADTKVRLSAEWIRRYDHDQAALTATDITSTLTLSLPTADPVRDQARFGLDVDHKLDAQTTLSFTVHVAGVGESPDISGAISLRRAF